MICHFLSPPITRDLGGVYTQDNLCKYVKMARVDIQRGVREEIVCLAGLKERLK